MKLADAHLHLFRRGYCDRYGAAWSRRDEIDVYEALRLAHGIDRGLVVGYEGQDRFRGNNRDVAAWSRTRPWLAPLAFVPADAPPSAAVLSRQGRDGFVGIAIYATGPREAAALARWPREVGARLGEGRRIVSLNAGPESIALLAPLLERLEGCSVLVSHLGLPGRCRTAPSRAVARNMLGTLRGLARLPHVGVKLSGLYAVSDPSHAYPHTAARPLLRQVLDDFGPERLYWGSDFSPALEHVSFAQTIGAVLELGWPDDVVRRIMHDNLAALLAGRGRRPGGNARGT